MLKVDIAQIIYVTLNFKKMKNTFFTDIRQEIISVLNNSQNQVCAMLAWFTDDILSKKLIEISKNVEILIILSRSEWNLLNKQNFETLIANGANIRCYGSRTPIEADFLHRKLCVVDKKIVMNGAYNWTKNASKNKEDYSINYSEEDAQNCLTEFFSLWEKSGPINFSELLESSTKTIEDIEDLENDGLSPEQYHANMFALVPVAKIEKPVVVTIKEPEKPVQMPNLFSINTIISPITSQQTLIYNEPLELWGIEIENYWLKLKFNIWDMIVDVAVETSEFIEMLKTDKELFRYWSLQGKRFPLGIFNESKPFIKLLNPIRVITYPKGYYNSRVKFRLLVEINGIIVQKFSHLRYDTYIHSYKGSIAPSFS